MSVRALALLAIAIAILASPGPLAAAPDPAALVSQARQAMAQLNYERAIQLLERAEESGENRRAQLVTIYRWLAESRAALGHAEAAESEFRRLLALDPDAALPRGSSPKFTDPFDAARDFMRQRQPLAVRCERRGDGAVLVVLSDPVDLVAAARPARADGDALARAASHSGRGRIALALPPGAPRELACTALDRHGNELALAPLLAASAGDGPDPSGILAPGEVERRQRSRAAAAEVSRERDAPAPPIYARWWLWGAGAAVAAGTGAYFAVQLQADEDDWRAIKRQSEQHTYAEALEVQERGERHARYGNIAMGTAAALAAVSVFLIVRNATAGESEASGTAVGAAPLPGGGAAATLQMSF